MPLDGTNFKVKIKPLQTGLAGMRQLADVLRFVTPDFHWDFQTLGCGTHGCLAGLSRGLWPDSVEYASIMAVAIAVKIPTEDLSPIMGGVGMEDVYGEKSHEQVTPHDVADAIDRYIAEKGGA